MNLQKLIPGFLKKFDQYLLKGFPLIWRTKIHFIGFYSLFLGNLTIVGLTMIYPLSSRNLPTNSSLEVTMFISCILAGFAILFWGYSQFKIKLTAPGFWALLTTAALYVFGSASIATNVYLFNSSLAYKISDTVSDQQLEKDRVYSRNNKFSYNHVESSEQAKEIIERYNLSHLVSTNKLYKPYKLDGAVEDKVDIVYNAKNHFANNPFFVGRIGSNFWTYFVFSALGMLTIPLLLLLLSFVKISRIFLVVFIHFLILASLIFVRQITWFNLTDYYMMLPFLFVLLAVLFRKNNSFSNTLFTVMLTIIPLSVFCWFMETNPYSDGFLLTSLLGLSLLSMLVTSVGGLWYFKRIVRPAS